MSASEIILDAELSRGWLREYFHPDGLCCPRCGSEQDDAYIFRRTKRSRLEVYRCKNCQKTYNLYSGTAFDGRHLRPEQVIQLLQGISRNDSTTRLARELGMSRTTIHEIRQKLDLDLSLPDFRRADAMDGEPDAAADEAPEPARPTVRPSRAPEVWKDGASGANGRSDESPGAALLRLFPEGLRPEDEVVIRCARAHTDSANDRRLRTLLGAPSEEPLDWAYLRAQARLHGLIPLVHRHLDRLAADLVPDDVLGELRGHARHIGYRNLRWTNELLRLHARFEAEGIPLVSFKGPVLAHAAYGNLALRPFVDLDLLVHRENMPRVKALLESEGYRPSPEMDARREGKYLDAQNPLAFVDDERRIVLEFHWAMIDEGFSYPLDPEQLWARLEPTALGGQTIDGLAVEDLLLYLCVHGAKHLWAQLLWISDLDALLRARPDLDWAAVLEQAARLRCERVLYLGLYLAMHLSAAPVPVKVRERVMQDTEVPGLAEQACATMYYRTHLTDVGWAEKRHLWLEKLQFRFKVREHLPDRTRSIMSQLRRALLPSRKDRAFVDLPRALTFLYVLVRPARILRDHWLTRFK